MRYEFFICGGELRIDKKIFIREMLRPESVMKQLLNYNLEDHGKTRSLKVDKTAKETVVISFNNVDNVGVGEDYRKLLAALKKDFRSKIKGSVNLTLADYFHAMFMTLDLNSDDDSITQHFE